MPAASGQAPLQGGRDRAVITASVAAFGGRRPRRSTGEVRARSCGVRSSRARSVTDGLQARGVALTLRVLMTPMRERMEAAIFDTHAYVASCRRRDAQAQAEIIADEQRGLIDNKLATKRDLKELEAATKRDLQGLETALKRGLKERDCPQARYEGDGNPFQGDIDAKLAETKAGILKWVAGLLLTWTAVIAALVKLLSITARFKL